MQKPNDRNPNNSEIQTNAGSDFECSDFGRSGPVFLVPISNVQMNVRKPKETGFIFKNTMPFVVFLKKWRRNWRRNRFRIQN